MKLSAVRAHKEIWWFLKFYHFQFNSNKKSVSVSCDSSSSIKKSSINKKKWWKKQQMREESGGATFNVTLPESDSRNFLKSPWIYKKNHFKVASGLGMVNRHITQFLPYFVQLSIIFVLSKAKATQNKYRFFALLLEIHIFKKIKS